MTIEQNEHFIARDGFGQECQRLYLPHHKKFSAHEYQYSAYHRSDYSFDEDIIYLGRQKY